MKTKKSKTTVVGSLLALAGLAVVFLPAYAGNLEPSAPPGPTMKTLSEVEPRMAVQNLSGDANSIYVLVNPARIT